MLIGQSTASSSSSTGSSRAHLETPDGSLVTGNASTEKTAAQRAKTPRAKKR